MEPETKTRIQLFLVIALLAAAARTGYVLYERHSEGEVTSSLKTGDVIAPAYNITLDDYVYLKPMHAHDVPSAADALSGKSVWVKAGNAVAYYPLAGSTVQNKQAGLLPPAARLNVKNVVLAGKEVYALFQFADADPKGTFAAPIGSPQRNGGYYFICDDEFYLDDPHKLYKHWPAPTWEAIDHHQVIKGMNERQAQMAWGVGRVVQGEGTDYGNRMLEYLPGGKKMHVAFSQDRAQSIEEAK